MHWRRNPGSFTDGLSSLPTLWKVGDYACMSDEDDRTEPYKYWLPSSLMWSSQVSVGSRQSQPQWMVWTRWSPRWVHCFQTWRTCFVHVTHGSSMIPSLHVLPSLRRPLLLQHWCFVPPPWAWKCYNGVVNMLKRPNSSLSHSNYSAAQRRYLRWCWTRELVFTQNSVR